MMLAYHELSTKMGRDVYALSPATFRRHLDAVRSLCGNQDCVTFDDGHISQWRLAKPILEQCGVHAIFFITTAWVDARGSVVGWDQLRQIQKCGHHIGSHTHTHPLLIGCGDAALRNELLVSRQILEDRLGIAVSTISMPGGRVDARVLACCKEAGYQRVYTSRVGQYQAPSDRSPEVVGRYVVTRSTRYEVLTAYIAGERNAWRRLKLEAAAKRVVRQIVGDSLYQKAWRKAFRRQSLGT